MSADAAQKSAGQDGESSGTGSGHKTNTNIVSIAESGFENLNRLMKGDVPDCPICLCAMESPTFMPCAHACCKGCIVGMFAVLAANQPLHGGGFAMELKKAKCPMCRRPIEMATCMEFIQPEPSVDEDGEGMNSGAAEANSTGGKAGGNAE